MVGRSAGSISPGLPCDVNVALWRFTANHNRLGLDGGTYFSIMKILDHMVSHCDHFNSPDLNRARTQVTVVSIGITLTFPILQNVILKSLCRLQREMEEAKSGLRDLRESLGGEHQVELGVNKITQPCFTN